MDPHPHTHSPVRIPRPQTVLETGGDSAHLAELLPKLWSDFIKNADVDELRPLGTRAVPIPRTIYRD